MVKSPIEKSDFFEIQEVVEEGVTDNFQRKESRGEDGSVGAH